MGLKILFLSHNFHPFLGGIEVISDALARNFIKQGNEVHLMTWTLADSMQDFPFKVIRNPDLFTLFREHKWADVVFENNLCLRLSWPAIFFNTPSVISLQTWICQKKKKKTIREKLKFLWLDRAKKVIACSSAVKNRCWTSSLVIGNPYQENRFQQIHNVPRNKDFVLVGRLVSDKGAELAVRAMSILKDNLKASIESNKSFRLTIVGKGPEKENLQNLVNQLSLKEEIEFTGPLEGEALVKCLNEHRFIVVPSLWEEPFGIVVLEGLACGCFPIVSNGGGLPEAVGKSGLLFRRGDVNDLVSCMTKVRNSPAIIKEYEMEGEKHLLAHRSENVANAYLKEIQIALKIKRGIKVGAPQRNSMSDISFRNS